MPRWSMEKKMKYKIVILTADIDTALKIYKMIQQSEIYNSSEIIQLQPVKEVCDECASK